MSESLNRAFLKAYDKEKMSEAKRQATAEQQRSQEVADLVTHFDTTSVPIPAPHFLKPKAREQAMVGSTTSNQSANSMAARNSAAQPVAMRAEVKPVALEEPDPTEENRLRDSIALQMMQAGDWEGQRIDAFIGGFPMLSNVGSSNQSTEAQAPSVTPTSPTRAQVVAVHQELEQTKETPRKSPGVEVVPMVEPAIRATTPVSEVSSQPEPARIQCEEPLVVTYESASIELAIEPARPTTPPTTATTATSNSAPVHSAPVDNPTPVTPAPVNSAPADPIAVESQAVEPITKVPTTAAPQAVERSQAEPARIEIPTPELQSPLAPALSQPPAQSPMGNTREQPAATMTLDDHLAKRSQGGDIFRLDRPSYAEPVKPASAAGTGAPATFAAEDYAELEHEDSSDSYSVVDLDRTPKTSHEVVHRTHFSTGANNDSPAPAQVAARGAVEAGPMASQRSQPMVEQSRQLEEKLRRARVRIFNPVWEVDSLQWPPVCLELMERLDGSLQHVADNLMTACQEGLQILAVTSPQRGEGTTTVACCLALLAGNHGLNVAIVDGDIEKPSLSYQTNLDVEQDWRSAILHQLPLEEVAVHSIDDQVTLVPLLNPISHHELSADDDRIGLMMHELSESFDLVIIDAGRMDSARSLVTILGERGIISAAVAVVDHRSSTPDRIELCLRRIRQSGIASIGLVENFAA